MKTLAIDATIQRVLNQNDNIIKETLEIRPYHAVKLETLKALMFNAICSYTLTADDIEDLEN